MEIYCYGTARVRHAVTGEVYSIAADELDWQDAGGDERPMGPAFHHEAMVEHPELGLMSWGVWEYPEGAENMTESNVGQHILVEDVDPTTGLPRVRGMFSATHIGRLLGVQIGRAHV